MARKKASQQQFTVSYEIKLFVGETIAAESLEAALAFGRERRANDVVDLDGLEYIDGEIEVKGVY